MPCVTENRQLHHDQRAATGRAVDALEATPVDQTREHAVDVVVEEGPHNVAMICVGGAGQMY